MPPAASYASSTWSLRYTSPANRRRVAPFTASAPSVSAFPKAPALPAASASIGFSIMIVVSSAPLSLSSDSETDPSISFPVESASSAPASPFIPVASLEAVRFSPILPTADDIRLPSSGRSVIAPNATMMPSRRTLHIQTQRFVPRGAPEAACCASLRCSVLVTCGISDFRWFFPRSLQRSFAGCEALGFRSPASSEYARASVCTSRSSLCCCRSARGP